MILGDAVLKLETFVWEKKTRPNSLLNFGTASARNTHFNVYYTTSYGYKKIYKYSVPCKIQPLGNREAVAF